ncbi:hypothetical protein FI667_g14638, partial [Globisporangium splendens]
MTPLAVAKNLPRRALIGATQLTLARSAVATERSFTHNASVRALVVGNSSSVPTIRSMQQQVRLMSNTTTNGGQDALNVWEAVRVMNANDVSTEERIDAIAVVKIDALEKLEKEQQALEIIESNAVVALLEFLKDADSTDASHLLIPAFLSLIRLSVEPLIAQELVRLEAPSLMAHFLTLPEPRLQAAASLTLGNIALDSTSEQAVSTPTVIENVLHVLTSPHEAIQRAAATSLANIAAHRLARERLCETTKAITTLSELLTAEHSFALGNILSGRDISAQDTLRENGGLAELVMLLSPAFSEEVSSSAAWAIHHAVHLNHQSQSLVGEAGGLNLLVQQLSAATVQLQTNALLALESAVEAHVQNQAWCRANDVVELLQQVEQDDGDDMDENAKRALTAILHQLE